MIKQHLLTLGASAALTVLVAVPAFAQGYVYSGPGYAQNTPAPYREADRTPNFDALDDDDDLPPSLPAPRVAAPMPGPVMSPDDPRYGRPMGPPPVYSERPPMPQGPVMSPDDPRYGRPLGAPPVYSDRGPQGPVMSPDDPRYGRPAGPPPVIYSDRPPGPPPQQTYSDRGNEDPRALRPPGAIGEPGGVTALAEKSVDSVAHQVRHATRRCADDAKAAGHCFHDAHGRVVDVGCVEKDIRCCEVRCHFLTRDTTGEANATGDAEFRCDAVCLCGTAVLLIAANHREGCLWPEFRDKGQDRAGKRRVIDAVEAANPYDVRRDVPSQPEWVQAKVERIRQHHS